MVEPLTVIAGAVEFPSCPGGVEGGAIIQGGRRGIAGCKRHHDALSRQHAGFHGEMNPLEAHRIEHTRTVADQDRAVN